MKQNFKPHFLLVLVFISFVFGACKNSSKEINDFLADKNLPIGVSENMHHVYKESGKVTSRLTTKLLWDYSNRKLNPYSEFPKGVKIVSINKQTRDSITVLGNYAISFSTTSFSEIIGDVVITNHKDGVVLNADQMYWDQKENYFFTESAFTLFTKTDTLQGVGFESNSALDNWILNNTHGDFIVDNNTEE
ncbi:LPS export ABC transporter periplasmic protein LptC [Flavobacteriaceae bacterium]|nr:LPS export ABC transporter periplasmic protein LptC [Flavobacteriaceae bacterium]